MNNYLHRAEKVLQRINQLASISDDANCINRMFATKAFIEGRNKVEQWFVEAGLQTHIDNIGNVRGKLLSENKEAKTLVIASHIDTVVNAGKFDGPMGVLLGLDLMENIIQTKTKLPFNIELIAFSDEEGVRFHTTYLGSKVVAGTFDKNVLHKKDESGIYLQEVIKQLNGNIDELNNDAISKKDWLGYYEIHIEQGPVLYEKNSPAAIVTSIAGQKRVEIIFKGIAGHAGTVPMNMRNDALCAASDFIIQLEEFASKQKSLVATVGKLNIINSASNVIPGEVICSLDVRSDDETILSIAYENIKQFCEEISKKRNIELQWNLIQQTKPVLCDNKMNKLLAASIKQSGYELTELVSGAGHDAVAISEVAPVCMLFVKCFKGISHNPLENVELEDIAAAIKVSDNFIKQLADAAE
jgi:allantoate deiminase